LLTKTIIVGSSSPLCKAIADHDKSGTCVFFGRTNPYGFKNWHEGATFTDEASVRAFSEEIKNFLANEIDSGVLSLNIIFVVGVSSNDWQQSFVVNEMLPSIIAQAFDSFVKGAPWLESASITLIGSTGAYRGAKLPYSATKASLTGIMHTLNKSDSITRTNLIVPTAFNGGMISDWDEAKIKSVANSNTIGRIGDVSEIADAIIFASNNQFVADSVINMSAGQVIIE
jgi:NAD(P)-dependent dehydrogenase (short-subunit alcohol dehydrogenase family)